MPRSVVVTGANSGIGRATALELARGGYDVIGTVRSEEKAAALTADADVRGLVLRTVLCDVADADSTGRAFARIAELTGGGPWAVVNNAGYAQPGAVEDVDDDAARAQLEVNLVAPARIARLVLPAMRARGEGRIVNVSSVAGRVSAPLSGWYTASKHGLEALTDALRMEVADFGVRVTLIEPGGFGTDIWEGARETLPASSAYAGAYARADAAIARAGALPDPVWVARVIRFALTTPLPQARYLVGFDAVGAVLADALTPTVVSDAVKSAAAGVRRLPLPFLGRGPTAG